MGIKGVNKMTREYTVVIEGTDEKTIENLALSLYRPCILDFDNDKSAQVIEISTKEEKVGE